MVGGVPGQNIILLGRHCQSQLQPTITTWSIQRTGYTTRPSITRMMPAQDKMCNFRSSLKLLCVRFHGAHLWTAHQDLERNLTQALRRIISMQ